MNQEKNIKILSTEEITQKLEEFPGWEYGNDKISKQFEFKSFLAGIDFVNSLASFCEEIDHHPDIHIAYKKIRFELQRFDVGGKVTDRDFTVARKIEELYKNYTV